MNRERVTYAIKFGDKWLDSFGSLQIEKRFATRFYHLANARAAARSVAGRIVKLTWRKVPTPEAERLRDEMVGGAK